MTPRWVAALTVGLVAASAWRGLPSGQAAAQWGPVKPRTPQPTAKPYVPPVYPTVAPPPAPTVAPPPPPGPTVVPTVPPVRTPSGHYPGGSLIVYDLIRFPSPPGTFMECGVARDTICWVKTGEPAAWEVETTEGRRWVTWRIEGKPR